MPRIRDGNNRVHEYDMGSPPAVPTGPAVRVDVPGEVERTPGISATGLPRHPWRADSNPLTRPDSRARGSAAAAEAKAKAKHGPKVPLAPEPTPADRMATFAADRAAKAPVEPETWLEEQGSVASTVDASQASIPAESVKSTGVAQTAAARAAIIANRNAALTPRQQQVVDELRRRGSRKAVQLELGMKHQQNVDSILVDVYGKGLLDPSLPDLPNRIRKLLVDPAGKTAGEVRRATRALAKRAHIVSAESQVEGQEAGAPATAAVDHGTTGATPAVEVATPPDPPDPEPGIASAYSAPDLPTPVEAGGGPVEGEDRCAFGRWLDGTVIFMCDRAAEHGGDVHRGRLVRANFVSGAYGVIGHAVVPA